MIKKRLTAIFILAVYCFVIGISFIFIITRADHNCTGSNCPICSEIQNCEAIIHNISSGFCKLALIIFTLCFFTAEIIQQYKTMHNSKTLVSLKIELLN